MVNVFGLFRTRACRSWRFVQVPGHTDHVTPGDCRDCWTVCTNQLSREEWSAGLRRCDDCAQSLVHCPLPQVRRALADEPNVSDDILNALLTDSNGPVSMKARRQLDARKPTTKRDALGTLVLNVPRLSSPRKDYRAQSIHEQKSLEAAARRTSVWGDD